MHFSWKSAPVHASTRARARVHTSMCCFWLHWTGLVWKNVSKGVYFWLWGKDNLVQLPEEPSVMLTVDAVCYSEAAKEFLKCVCWRPVYKAQFNAGFALHLILKDGAVPVIKDPGHEWFRTADGKWNGIKCMRFAGDRARVLVNL